jgi:hypothetical protein
MKILYLYIVKMANMGNQGYHWLYLANIMGTVSNTSQAKCHRWPVFTLIYVSNTVYMFSENLEMGEHYYIYLSVYHCHA